MPAGDSQRQRRAPSPARNCAVRAQPASSVWWLRLGIGIERIKPGHPQQNGRHERMHLTLKQEATKPAAGNFLQQQASASIKFIEVFNSERPHEALDMRCPAEVYAPFSAVRTTACPSIEYPSPRSQRSR